MITNCDTDRMIYSGCGCHANNKAVICSALVALILINVLNEECIESVSAFLNSTGELLAAGITQNGCGCR